VKYKIRKSFPINTISEIQNTKSFLHEHCKWNTKYEKLSPYLLRKLFVFCISLLVFMGKAFSILYFTYNVYGESFSYFVFHLQCLWRKLFVFCISLTMFMGKAFRILYFTYNVYGESFMYFVFHLQCLCRKFFGFCISLLVFMGKAFRILYFTYNFYG
jgi:hypothetical protein